MDVGVWEQKLYYTTLERVLNAFVKSVLFEPHCLNAKFARVNFIEVLCTHYIVTFTFHGLKFEGILSL
jgi:hypothetical protein